MDFKGLEFDGVPIDDDDSSLDDVSQENAILEEEIDYDCVYALYDFVAMVQGQVSAKQGEKLSLLDDSNSYWWLTQVHSTNQIGYIPADNIELTQVDPEHLTNPKGTSLKPSKRTGAKRNVVFNKNPVSEKFSTFFSDSESGESEEHYDSEYDNYYENSQYQEDSEDELSYIDEPDDYEYNSESSELSDDIDLKIPQKVANTYTHSSKLEQELSQELDTGNKGDQSLNEPSVYNNKPHLSLEPRILPTGNNSDVSINKHQRQHRDNKLSLDHIYTEPSNKQLKRKSTDSVDLLGDDFALSKPNDSPESLKNTESITNMVREIYNENDDINSNNITTPEIQQYFVPVSFSTQDNAENSKQTILKILPNETFSQIIKKTLDHFSLPGVSPSSCNVEAYVTKIDQAARIDLQWTFTSFLKKLEDQVTEINFVFPNGKVTPDQFILAIHLVEPIIATATPRAPSYQVAERKPSKLAGIIHYSESEDEQEYNLKNNHNLNRQKTSVTGDSADEETDNDTDGEYTPIEYNKSLLISEPNNNTVNNNVNPSSVRLSTSLFSDRESDLDNSISIFAASSRKRKALEDKSFNCSVQHLESQTVKDSSTNTIVTENQQDKDKNLGKTDHSQATTSFTANTNDTANSNANSNSNANANANSNANANANSNSNANADTDADTDAIPDFNSNFPSISHGKIKNAPTPPVLNTSDVTNTNTNSNANSYSDINSNNFNSKSSASVTTNTGFNTKPTTNSIPSSITTTTATKIHSIPASNLGPNINANTRHSEVSFIASNGRSTQIFKNITKDATFPSKPPPASAYERHRIKSLRNASVSSMSSVPESKSSLSHQNQPQVQITRSMTDPSINQELTNLEYERPNITKKDLIVNKAGLINGTSLPITVTNNTNSEDINADSQGGIKISEVEFPASMASTNDLKSEAEATATATKKTSNGNVDENVSDVDVDADTKAKPKAGTEAKAEAKAGMNIPASSIFQTSVLASKEPLSLNYDSLNMVKVSDDDNDMNTSDNFQNGYQDEMMLSHNPSALLLDPARKTFGNLANTSPEEYLTPTFSPGVDSDVSSVFTADTGIPNSSKSSIPTISTAAVVVATEAAATSAANTTNPVLRVATSAQIETLATSQPKESPKPLASPYLQRNLTLDMLKSMSNSAGSVIENIRTTEPVLPPSTLNALVEADSSNQQEDLADQTEPNRFVRPKHLYGEPQASNSALVSTDPRAVASSVEEHHVARSALHKCSEDDHDKDKDIGHANSGAEADTDASASLQKPIDINTKSGLLDSIDYLAQKPLGAKPLLSLLSPDPFKENTDLTSIESNVESMSSESATGDIFTSSDSSSTANSPPKQTQNLTQHNAKIQGRSALANYNLSGTGLDKADLSSITATGGGAILSANKFGDGAQSSEKAKLTNFVPDIKRSYSLFTEGGKLTSLNPRVGRSSSTTTSIPSTLPTLSNAPSTVKNHKLSLAMLSRKGSDFANLSKPNDLLLQKRNLQNRSSNDEIAILSASPTAVGAAGAGAIATQDANHLIHQGPASVDGTISYVNSSTHTGSYGYRSLKGRNTHGSLSSLVTDRYRKLSFDSRSASKSVSESIDTNTSADTTTNTSTSSSINHNSENIGEMELPLDNWLVMIGGWLDYDTMSLVETHNTYNPNSYSISNSISNLNSDGSDNTFGSDSPYILIEQEFMRHNDSTRSKTGFGLRSSASYQQLLNDTSNNSFGANYKPFDAVLKPTQQQQVSQTQAQTQTQTQFQEESNSNLVILNRSSGSASSDERTANEPNSLESIYKESIQIYQKLDILQSDLTSIAKLLLNSS